MRQYNFHWSMLFQSNSNCWGLKNVNRYFAVLRNADSYNKSYGHQGHQICLKFIEAWGYLRFTQYGQDTEINNHALLPLYKKSWGRHLWRGLPCYPLANRKHEGNKKNQYSQIFQSEIDDSKLNSFAEDAGNYLLRQDHHSILKIYEIFEEG